jgi:hypothetical protein
MRKLILIAGFALVSVAAHAGDRSLSLGGGETTRVSAPANAIEGSSRTAEAPQAAEAPKYVERPAAVEPKAEPARTEQARSETSRASAGNAARMRQRPAGMQQGYAGRPSAGAGGASARRAAMMQQRGAGAHRARFGIKARIITALHRHGIYW